MSDVKVGRSVAFEPGRQGGIVNAAMKECCSVARL